MKRPLFLAFWIMTLCPAPGIASGSIRLGSLGFELVEIAQPMLDTVNHYTDQDSAVFYCIPRSINSSGTIVGMCTTAAGGLVGYKYNGEYNYYMGPPPVCDEGGSYAGYYTGSGSEDITDDGRFLLFQVVNCWATPTVPGEQRSSYILGHGTTQLTIPQVARDAVPSGMNNIGQAVGSGYIWPSGTKLSVSFSQYGEDRTFVTDINDSGDVVGSMYAIVDGKSAYPRSVGFVYTKGGDLIEITYPGYKYDDLQLVEAYHVNREGTVVGW